MPALVDQLAQLLLGFREVRSDGVVRSQDVGSGSWEPSPPLHLDPIPAKTR